LLLQIAEITPDKNTQMHSDSVQYNICVLGLRNAFIEAIVCRLWVTRGDLCRLQPPGDQSLKMLVLDIVGNRFEEEKIVNIYVF
jgi:hypothetical protein